MRASPFPGRYRRLRLMIDRKLAGAVKHGAPTDLTDGCRYVLAGGGKRIRSTLLLLSCEAVGGSARQALDAGAAVEMMHNYTLVHDDIMDHAPSRRGRPTVHMRWDVNNALLVGDVVLGMAYRSLLKTRTRNLARVVGLFTSGLIEVCLGQGLDLEFARRRDVSIPEYFAMIEKKTGRMISMAAELGGVIGGGGEPEIRALRRFGHYLGRAFQLQDDLLDVVADGKRFGKAIGGDIVEGKRTFLLLRAVERAGGKDKALLQGVLETGSGRDVAGRRSRSLVAQVTALYERYGIMEEARTLIRRDTRQAVASLDGFRRGGSRDMLLWLSEALLDRSS